MVTGDSPLLLTLCRPILQLAYYVLLVETNTFPGWSWLLGICNLKIPSYFLEFTSYEFCALSTSLCRSKNFKLSPYFSFQNMDQLTNLWWNWILFSYLTVKSKNFITNSCRNGLFRLVFKYPFEVMFLYTIPYQNTWHVSNCLKGPPGRLGIASSVRLSAVPYSFTLTYKVKYLKFGW